MPGPSVTLQASKRCPTGIQLARNAADWTLFAATAEGFGVYHCGRDLSTRKIAGLDGPWGRSCRFRRECYQSMCCGFPPHCQRSLGLNGLGFFFKRIWNMHALFTSFSGEPDAHEVPDPTLRVPLANPVLNYIAHFGLASAMTEQNFENGHDHVEQCSGCTRQEARCAGHPGGGLPGCFLDQGATCSDQLPIGLLCPMQHRIH